MLNHNSKKVVVTLLTILFLISFAATLTTLTVKADSTNTDWSMYRNSPAHIGISTSNAPLTNHTIWTYATNNTVHSSPTIVNGVLYEGLDTSVYAIDASTAAQLWSFTAADIVSSTPAVVGGVVYVGSNDNNVYALDATTGNELWAYKPLVRFIHVQLWSTALFTLVLKMAIFML